MSDPENETDFEFSEIPMFCPYCSHQMAEVELPIILDDEGQEKVVTQRDEVAALRERGEGIWSDFFVCPNCGHVIEDDFDPGIFDNIRYSDDE
jgi:hypothetical protein